MSACPANIDWTAVFLPATSPLEVVVRGTVMYLALFAMLRLVLKRQSGAMGVTDLLVIVLIADAAQNGMAGQYTSVCDGLVLVATLIFWSYALDWLSYRFPRLGRILQPPPLPLVRDGRPLHRNLRQELISMDELKSQLREQGIEDLSEVRTACMEHDGRISIVKRKSEVQRQPDRPGVR